MKSSFFPAAVMFTVASFFSSATAWAGFSTNLTRVIYNENEKRAAISVNSSKDSNYFLVQSWVETQASERAEFMVTPPIIKLAPGTQNTLNIKYLGEPLPADRESLFYLNIKAIPAKNTAIDNQVVIANKSILKLIYRPKGLRFDNAVNSPQQLKFVRENGHLVITNPTAFYINFSVFSINGKRVNELSFIAPQGRYEVAAPSVSAPVDVRYSTINDFGGQSSETRLVL